jgi:hypothetical protein
MRIGQVREERFQLLLTRDERQRLEEMALAAGVDMSTMIRLRVFGPVHCAASERGDMLRSSNECERR